MQENPEQDDQWLLIPCQVVPARAPKPTHNCGVCARVCASVSKLQTHLRTHTDEKPFSCAICGQTFRTQSSLRAHRLHTHSDGKNFACPRDGCTKKFKFPGDLRRHERLTHTKDRAYMCSICGSSFQTSDHCNIHMRQHTGERPYACTECPATFTSSSKLNAHKTVHQSEKPFECQICSKSFSTNLALNRHKKMHQPSHVKPYQCKWCPKAYRQSSSLNEHKRKQHALEQDAECDESTSSTNLLEPSAPSPIEMNWCDSFVSGQQLTLSTQDPLLAWCQMPSPTIQQTL